MASVRKLMIAGAAMWGANLSSATWSGAQGCEMVSFEPEIEKRIEYELIPRIVTARMKAVNRLDNALSQFETTVTVDGTEDPSLTVPYDPLSEMINVVVDLTVVENPALEPYVVIGRYAYGAIGDGLKNQARRPQNDYHISDWIKDQRRTLADAFDKAIDVEQLRNDLDCLYPSYNDPIALLDALFSAVPEVEKRLESLEVIEVRLYEQWINGQFTGISNDGLGYIDIAIDYEGQDVSVGLAHVKLHPVELGEKFDRALNRLMRLQATSLRARVLDFKVNKRVCLWGDNLIGGKHWSCGWLDADNATVRSPPLLPVDMPVYESGLWRTLMRQFHCNAGDRDRDSRCQLPH